MFDIKQAALENNNNKKNTTMTAKSASKILIYTNDRCSTFCKIGPTELESKKSDTSPSGEKA